MIRPPRPLFAALLASLLAVSTAWALGEQDSGARAENTSRVGPWSVWCARDGALSGLHHEECRMWIAEGANRIDATRTHDGMSVRLSGPWCRKSASGAPPSATILERRELARTQTAAARLQRAFDTAADTCGAPRPTFRAADLEALLRETSGLSNETF